MSINKVLSQEEIDSVFRKLAQGPATANTEASAVAYDFRRPDRIPKDQLRDIHLLHENFCRNLAGSLSAYLRAYVTVNLISVLQLSYSEFLQCFPSPTSVSVLSLHPFDGKGILELNPSLAFPIIEILLGGQGKSSDTPKREITEIERSILDGALRVILKDLREAWTGVANFEFALERSETEPQLIQTLSPNEAVVAVGVEVKLGDCTGMLNFAVPAVTVKMLRQRFDHRWSHRKGEQSKQELARMMRLVEPSLVEVDAQIEGSSISLKSLLNMQVGDTIAMDYPVTRPLQVCLNGMPKYVAHVTTQSEKKAVRIETVLPGRGYKAPL